MPAAANSKAGPVAADASKVSAEPMRIPPVRTRLPGNQALLRLQRKCACGGQGTCPACRLQQKRIQTKVPVGPVDDSFEREADSTADRVMRMDSSESLPATPSQPQIQRACDACEEEEDDGVVRRKAIDASESASPALDAANLVRGGVPLPEPVREYFERRFGLDFSSVRIHMDADSHRANVDLHSHAFTFGDHIWLAQGQTVAPNHLLAHELTHVVQQTSPPPPALPKVPQQPLTGMAAPPSIQRDPPTTTLTRSDQPAASSSCISNIQVGAARADVDNHRMGPSGTYSIWGPRYSPDIDYIDTAIRAWIRWRFGTLSSAVTERIRIEATGYNWTWESGLPNVGCQGVLLLSMDTLRRLTGFANRDPAARAQDVGERASGLPELPPPGPIADYEMTVTAPRTGDGPTTSTGPQAVDTRAAAERALDPTSVYEGGVDGQANMPPFPATMDGPEYEVLNGIGTYNMALHYERVTASRLVQMALYMNPVEYRWELFNVTQMVRAGMGAGALQEARRMGTNSQAARAADQANRQRISNDIDQLSEETVRSWHELRDPRRAAEGGSAVDVITRAYANQLNLALLPASAIIAAGGWLVHAIAGLFGRYSNEKEISFPGTAGYYMVRCIAQPHDRGPDRSEHYAASVSAKLIEVTTADRLGNNVLDLPAASIAELELQKTYTTDAATLAELDRRIAAVREQTGGDLVGYLRRLVADKNTEIAAAPSWERSRLERERDTLQLRLDQAISSHSGAEGVHHRPRVAFTSIVTGDTYPMLLELTEIPIESGYRVRLMDVTVPDRPPIDRNGATREQAVRNAFYELAMHSSLGRGQLIVRMPDSWTGGPAGTFTVETGDASTAIVRRRLQDLATALLILSIWVPGVGQVAAVIGAGLAVERIARRVANGTFRVDAEAISDTLAILGAIAQGAQLVGQLRVVRAGRSFIAAAREGEQAVLQTAAEALDAARRVNQVLTVTNTVVNAGGMLWGDLVMLDRLAQIAADEMADPPRITHSEARRQRADLLASAIRDHGIMLHGMMRPEGADRPAGNEPPAPGSQLPPADTAPATPPREAPTPTRPAPETPPVRPQPETPAPARPAQEAPAPARPAPEAPAPARPAETAPEPAPREPRVIQESELERRAGTAAEPATGTQPAPRRPDGVRMRFRTPDGLHDIFVLNNGQIFRCSLSCAQIRVWYDSYLHPQQEGTHRQRAAELESNLRAMEARAAAGENSPAFQEQLGALDVAMRDFIAPELTRELQARAEGNEMVRPGQQLLAPEQVRRLLRFFNVDELQMLTGSEGPGSAEAVRRLANRPEAFLQELRNICNRLSRPVNQMAQLLEGVRPPRLTESMLMDVLRNFSNAAESAVLGTLVDNIAAGGQSRANALDFIGRVARIRTVDGVVVNLPELHTAFLAGDAILDHGPIQTGEFANDIFHERVTLGEGRLDVGTSGGRMPASFNPRVLDFVIVQLPGGGEHLILGREHSGLSTGRTSVFAAGSLVFDRNGVVIEINNGSGHYLPSRANLDRAFRFMMDRNILSPQREVAVRYIE